MSAAGIIRSRRDRARKHKTSVRGDVRDSKYRRAGAAVSNLYRTPARQTASGRAEASRSSFGYGEGSDCRAGTGHKGPYFRHSFRRCVRRPAAGVDGGGSRDLLRPVAACHSADGLLFSGAGFQRRRPAAPKGMCAGVARPVAGRDASGRTRDGSRAICPGLACRDAARLFAQRDRGQMAPDF